MKSLNLFNDFYCFIRLTINAMYSLQPSLAVQTFGDERRRFLWVHKQDAALASARLGGGRIFLDLDNDYGFVRNEGKEKKRDILCIFPKNCPSVYMLRIIIIANFFVIKEICEGQHRVYIWIRPSPASPAARGSPEENKTDSFFFWFLRLSRNRHSRSRTSLA